MNDRKSEKGVVLLMVLILSAVALAVVTALLYLALVGTQTSGMQKRYRTALEAGIAGSDILTQVIALQQGDISTISGSPLYAVSTVASGCTGSSLYSGQTYSGLLTKIKTSTASWSGCDSSLLINTSSATTYDLSFSVGASPVYTVYAKIVDTVEGNTSGKGMSGGNTLVTTGVVSNSGGEVQVKAIPSLYTLEVDAENSSSGTKERAKLQVLYQN